jgi:uncharacterized membrane protein
MSKKSRGKQQGIPSKPSPVSPTKKISPGPPFPMNGPADQLDGPTPRLSILAHRSQQVTQSFSGPIPPPEILKAYDEIEPGTARRILAQAEMQTAHRIEIEKTSINSEIRRSNWGLVAGFVVAMASIVGGCLLVWAGHDVAGATIATGSVVALVGVFVYGTATRQKERLERTKILTGGTQPPTQ